MIEKVRDKPKNAPRRQQQRSLVTQQKLLDAAIEAFSENGFKGTSTRDIAERAGVHHPLITYHFKNKDRLWRAAAERVFSEFEAALESARDNSGEHDARSRVTSLIRTYVRFAYRRPALHKILVQESNHPNPRLDWLIGTFLKPLFSATVDDITELQASGVAPDGDAALLFAMMRATASGLVAQRLEIKGTSGIDFDAPGALDELTELLERVFLSGGVSRVQSRS